MTIGKKCLMWFVSVSLKMKKVLFIIASSVDYCRSWNWMRMRRRNFDRYTNFDSFVVAVAVN